jgi:alpha-1,4-digalacturonate transport system permease protein
VPNFLVASSLGLLNSPWASSSPVATPTGVFLLRHIPRAGRALDAARMDHASEWRIFWRIVHFPLRRFCARHLLGHVAME